MFAEEADAEPGAESRLDVEEDAGAGGRDVMNAPVPEQGGEGSAKKAAESGGYPGSCAQARDGERRGSGMGDGIEEPGAEYDDGEHGGSGKDGIGRDDEGAVIEHELLAEEDPGEGGDERGDDEEISRQRWLAVSGRAAAAAEDDERGPAGGTGESQPAEPVEAFAGEKSGGAGQQDGHGAHHERGVAHSGESEAVELKQELDGNAEGGGDEERPGFGAGETETGAVGDGQRQHADRSEEEAIEHHVLHAHFIERKTAPVEARAPEAAGQGTCAITEEGDFAAGQRWRRAGLGLRGKRGRLRSLAQARRFLLEDGLIRHLSLLSHTGGRRAPLPKTAGHRRE